MTGRNDHAEQIIGDYEDRVARLRPRSSQMGAVSILHANEGDTSTLYGRAWGAAAEQDIRRHLHRELTEHSERHSGCSIAQHVR